MYLIDTETLGTSIDKRHNAMDCCYSNRDGSVATEKEFPNFSSPEMFDSDYENEREDNEIVKECDVNKVVSPVKPSQADLTAQSDNNLLARINRLLCGVPPPPKLTICRTDCSELLQRIYENKHLFWTSCALSEKQIQHDGEFPEPHKENISTNNYQRTKSTSRNLSTAFDACDPQCQSSVSCNVDTIDLKETCSDNVRIKNVVPNNEESIVNANVNRVNPGRVRVIEDRMKQASALPEKQLLLYHTIDEKQATALTWPEAYHHKCYGIHYNTNKTVEEFENLTLKLCERYIGAETQSTCTVWFSKPAPGSAQKRNLLAKRNSDQSPGKRLSHLTRRRKVFSSANLQGLALNNKKFVVLNIKKPAIKKGKSPRGKSPRGKSPRGKSPRGKSPRGTPKSSTKKRVARRLILDGSSPLKARIESSKRALFQSPPTDRAGPSKLFTNGSNPQSIKRVLFAQNTKENDFDVTQSVGTEESRKRKNEEKLEGPRSKWAKSLSFACPHEIHNNTVSWDRHSSSNIIEKSKPSVNDGRCGLSDAHRKKLLWAISEALRTKGIGMTHPQFKQYASNLARIVKKYMPDLENRNIPRKPGSTSDRMLKIAKLHVVLVVDPKPAD